MDDKLKQYEQEIRQIIISDFKKHILYVGDEVLESDIFAFREEREGARVFWEKLQTLCL